ncbi:MAG: TrkH family potassium uptake protein [Candidatus Aerophobetes bacterium]|nr:TrkH family potassium uptake protein [Candidatus Aerophobetes bacterium]
MATKHQGDYMKIYNPEFRFYLNVAAVGACLSALFSFIWEYGFYLPKETKSILHQLDILIVIVFVSELLLKFILAENKRLFIKDNWPDFSAGILFVSAILTLKVLSTSPQFVYFLNTKGIYSLSRVYIIISQIYILASLIIRIPYLNKIIFLFRLPPPSIVILTFISIIAVGTFLLLLPKSTVSGKETTFLDALFTATSATCVTGLIVVDTGSHFSLSGQLIILILIQIGGLGLMTFTSFFALALGKGFGLKDRFLLRDILSYKNMGGIGSLILSILRITFIIEGIGALLLYIQFLPQTKGALSCLYSAIFHSISAFCNAGFSLYSDSFMRYTNSLGINLVMSALIITGGLGFIVIVDLLHRENFRLRGKKRSLSLQSKLVLLISFLLIGIGFCLILLSENNELLDNFSLKGKLLGAYFQSVTARTAGFNTLNIRNLGIFSSFLLIIFMFIGASAGSTGGGIKTSTFAALFFTIKSMVQGKSEVEVFKRTLPRLVVYQALSVTTLALGWIAISVLILTLTENAPFIDILFESFSAFGTVGLSRGITPNLTSGGRIIITLTMLIGRVGPLTLALAIGGRKMVKLYEYPEESIMIG